jgi:hypothetical protein
MRELAISRPVGRLLCFWWVAILAVCSVPHAWAATPARTQVVDNIFRADGAAAKGTLLISWSAFVTANGDAVAAGQMSAPIGADGKVNVWLVPNTGSTPQSSYRVTVKLDSGVTSEEYWTVPAAATTTIAAIRSKVAPVAVAQQFVGRDYVDTKFSQVSSSAYDASAVHKTGDETIDGVKQFLKPPVVPAPQSVGDAANKSYVDASAGIKATQPNTFTAQQKFNVEPVTPVNVQFYGAMGVAGVDYAAELQAALDASIASGAKLYFPCGQYNTSKMLTYYGVVVPGIEAQNPWCARISYTGAVDVAHTLEVGSSASHSDYITGGGISGITIEGNAHVTVSALGLYRPNNVTVRDVFLGPANATTGACMYVLSGVANHFANISCNQGRRGNWDSLKPQYGFVFDGVSPYDESTTSTIDVPTIQGVSGIALWLKAYSGGFVLNSCQIGDNGQAAQVDGSFHTFNSCLFELSSSATSVEVAGQSNTFVESFFSETSPRKLSITGKKIKFQGGYVSAADVVVASSARNVMFEGVSLNPAKLTDSAPDTRYDNSADEQNNGAQLQNFAAHKQSPPNTGAGVGTFDPVVDAQGTWTASATTPTVMFANTFTTGKAWRAYFWGQVLVGGTPIEGSAPRMFELTDGNNSLTTFGANNISFSVDGATGKFTMASTASNQGFSGTVKFIPTSNAAGTEQAVSMQLTGTLNAAAVAARNGGFTSTLQASSLSANNTLTLPSSTDTLVGLATTDTLTNKTFDTGGAGNVLKIAGAQVSSVSGSGSVVLQSGPTLTGTVTASTLTSASGSNLYLISASGQNSTLTAASGGMTFLGSNGTNSLVLDTSPALRPVAAGGVALGTTGNPWSNLYLGTAGTNNIKVTGTATAARTATFPDASITVSGAKAYDCGATTTCANTNNSASVRIVSGVVTLASGTATVSGISPAFTSTSSFVCVGTDRTSAAAVKIANASTSSITVTGTGTDVVGYQCVGI